MPPFHKPFSHKPRHLRWRSWSPECLRSSGFGSSAPILQNHPSPAYWYPKGSVRYRFHTALTDQYILPRLRLLRSCIPLPGSQQGSHGSSGNHLRSGPAAFPCLSHCQYRTFLLPSYFSGSLPDTSGCPLFLPRFPLFHYQPKRLQYLQTDEAVYIRELLPHRPYPGSVLTSLKKHLPTHPEGSAEIHRPHTGSGYLFFGYICARSPQLYLTPYPLHYVRRYHCTV